VKSFEKNKLYPTYEGVLIQSHPEARERVLGGCPPGFESSALTHAFDKLFLFLKDRFAPSWLDRSSNWGMRLAASIVHRAPGVPGLLVRPVRKVRWLMNLIHQ
jgi:hypothetical protein